MSNRLIRTLAAGAVVSSMALSALPAPVFAQAPASAAPSAPAPVPGDKPMGSGPTPAIMLGDPGLPTHTVYRPTDLTAVKGPLPIVAWGNGACVNVGNRFRWFLSEVSSYGYFVVAIGPIGPASAEQGPQPTAANVAVPGAAPVAPPEGRAPATRAHQLIDALDWAIAENARPASPYYHRLDTSKIAIMGQSCGGVQAIEASADPRVTTSIIWNSGLFTKPSAMGGGKVMSKDDLKAFHAPVAYISGDPSDVAFLNANDDFSRITGVAAFRGWEHGVPHTGTYREANGGEFGGVAVAWLNWRLKGDAKAARMFTGADCGLCVNPRWVVEKKGID